MATRPRLRGRTLLAGLLLVLLTGCGGSAIDDTNAYDRQVLGGGKALTVVAPEDRKPAAVVTGPDLAGTGTVTSSRPGQVVVLNVWASWCGPCRQEAPELNAASKDLADDAVFIGLNVREASPDPGRAFVRATEVPYAHIYDPDGTQLIRFSADLSPSAIPSTLIIDRQGRTAVRIAGTVSRTTLVQLVRDIAAEPR
ncbi:TlpA family protein disulfide reductase [Microlunatus antarcticus]|uniref:Thiol-disulfide isomerase/thioredoxin n=1 Tax=Microlunatus antarcticus TaxID=53388 RepID=A0A7W5JUP7_9ACTN|nr:TlpA disulfide reductase family protein [Microlunatus antarcticus]MBB3326583.1 thiol-disulfide isomerase/thioredoxin [Microlunatus antarcticus]